MSKIYVGNLAWGTTDDTLRAAFTPFGPVTDVIVMKDPQTGRSRGFGFVTFGSQQEADNAISSMNDQELDGRRLKVNVANQRTGGGGASSGAYQGGHPQGGGFQGQGQPYGGYAQQNFGGYPNQGFPTQQGFGQQGYPQQGFPTNPGMQGGYPQQGYQQPFQGQDGSQTGYSQYPPQGFQQGYGGGYGQ